MRRRQKEKDSTDKQKTTRPMNTSSSSIKATNTATDAQNFPQYVQRMRHALSISCSSCKPIPLPPGATWAERLAHKVPESAADDETKELTDTGSQSEVLEACKMMVAGVHQSSTRLPLPRQCQHLSIHANLIFQCLQK